MEKTSWTDHVTNEKVLERAEENRQLINLIRERQVRWIGHTTRSESLLKRGKNQRQTQSGGPC